MFSRTIPAFVLAVVAMLVAAPVGAQVVQANYPLTVDLLDTTGTYGPVMLTGNAGPAPAPPTAGGVCHNGNYYFSGGPGQDIRSPDISSLDATDFQIDLEFNITSFQAGNMPILMMGNGWRWIGLYVQPTGTLGAKHNNSNMTWSTTTVAAGTWYSASLRFESGILQIDLNGVQIHQDLAIGALNTGNDMCFTTNDFSNGSAYNGCIRNVTLSNDTTLLGGSDYQVNSAISSLDLDGVSGSAFAGAETTVCVGGATTLNSASATGTPTDIAVVFAGTGPTMALSSFNNVVNIDVFHPTMFSFNGGAPNFAGLLNLQPHPGAFSFLVPTGGPFVGSAQQLAVDPSNADGYALSQASQLTVTVGGTVTFAHADDGFVQAFINAPPLCGTSVDFYGTSYTDIFSQSNGWASFTAGNADFTATVAEWQTNEPRLGFGADLEPNNFGTVTLTNLGPALSGSPGASNLVMSYAGVTEWGTGGLGVTSYDIVLNGANGHEIANFTTDGTWGVTPTVAGMSLGAGGTHPAQVSFDGLFGAGLQANVAGTDSVLDANPGGMLANATGWSNIVFPLLDGSAYLVL